MPTDDERREVATRLRGLDAKITNRNTLKQAVNKFTKAVCGDIPFSPIRYSARNLCGLANMLADLIEPEPERTCRDFGDVEGTNGEGYDFACGACGFCCDLPQPNYCPNCGAKIIE